MDVPMCIYLDEDIEMEELGNKAPPNPAKFTPLGAYLHSNRH